MIEHLPMVWRTGDILPNTSWFHNAVLIQYLLARLSEEFPREKKLELCITNRKKKKHKQSKKHFSYPLWRKLFMSVLFDPKERVVALGRRSGSLPSFAPMTWTSPLFLHSSASAEQADYQGVCWGTNIQPHGLSPQLPSLQGLQGCSTPAVEEPAPQHFHVVNSHSILLCSILSIL